MHAGLLVLSTQADLLLASMTQDDWRWHMYDTVKGSDWLGAQNAIHYMMRETVAAIVELEHYGMPFSRIWQLDIPARLGRQSLNYDTGEQAYRTACAADRTGHAMLHTLYGQNLKLDCQYFIEYLVLDLMLIRGKCVRVTALSMEDGILHRIFARNAVLTTGGKYKTTQFSPCEVLCLFSLGNVIQLILLLLFLASLITYNLKL